MYYTYRYNEKNGNWEILENIPELDREKVIKLCRTESHAKFLVKFYIDSYFELLEKLEKENLINRERVKL